jgi:hypothetical protein
MPEIQTPTLHAHHKPITTPPLTMPKCNIHVAGWQVKLETQVISMEEEDISLQCMLEQGITLHRTPELIEESCAEHAGQLRRFFLRSGFFFPPLFLIKFFRPHCLLFASIRRRRRRRRRNLFNFLEICHVQEFGKIVTVFMKIVFVLGFRLRLL